MDTINSLTEKVNTKTSNTPIFYIGNDAERALGLEKLLTSFHIICIDDNEMVDYMLKEGVQIFCLEKERGELNELYRNSNRLLLHELTQEYIKKETPPDIKGYLMVFKMAPNIERTAKKMGFSLLNTTAALNRKFELKLSQYEALKNLPIKLPETVITSLDKAEFESLSQKLSPHFVVQFNRGHTGMGTIMIDAKSDLDDIKEQFPHREVRISRHIYGDAYTLNACATKYGIYWGGLSFQITGIEECTSRKGGTVGNDWSFPQNLSQKVMREIDAYTRIIGKEMKQHGFQGMFGLDIVLEKETNIPYIIEINARQPASIPMFTKLQIAAGEIPLSLISLAEFLGIDYDIPIDEYNKKASSPFEAAQLFIRNKFDNDAIVIGGIKVGVYKLRGDNSAFSWDMGKPELKPHVIFLTEEKDTPLIFDSEAYAIDGIKNDGLLLLCVHEGKKIASNGEVARLQITQTLLDTDGNLKYWVRQLVAGLQKYIILRELPS
jgi:hypothetical protein